MLCVERILYIEGERMLNSLENRVLAAQTDHSEANRLISEYLPLIKSQVSAAGNESMDYDDMLSIGMLGFLDAINQYDPNRGSFVSYATLIIKNRLIDEYRKTNRNAGRVIHLYQDDADEKTTRSIDETASIQEYQIEQERKLLAEEIELLKSELERYGVSFQELTKICPKQERSRKQCAELAGAIVSNPSLKEDFIRNSRIPQTALSEQFKISPKTIEKHRKYIVTIVVMLLGDYPGICTFLPKEVG